MGTAAGEGMSDGQGGVAGVTEGAQVSPSTRRSAASTIAQAQPLFMANQPRRAIPASPAGTAAEATAPPSTWRELRRFWPWAYLLACGRRRIEGGKGNVGGGRGTWVGKGERGWWNTKEGSEEARKPSTTPSEEERKEKTEDKGVVSLSLSRRRTCSGPQRLGSA